MKKYIDAEKILTWFEDTFQDGEVEDWYLERTIDSVVAPYKTKDILKEELSGIIDSLQQEQPNNMIQWTGNNLKEVIDFTGKSPRFGEWFNSWDEYEKYVHTHNDILKLFCEDGSHYEVPVGAWIVKTPDGYNVPSVARFIHAKQEQPKVDWEKEIDKFLNETGAPYVWCNDDEQKEWCNIIARHFWNKGYNARKKEEK